jgi:hypothetical protein
LIYIKHLTKVLVGRKGGGLVFLKRYIGGKVSLLEIQNPFEILDE